MDQGRFDKLADTWERETAWLSSPTSMAEHPAYKEIIAAGDVVVPLILDRMRKQGGHWFIALHAITGSYPVPYEDRGNISKMTEAWLTWGEENGRTETAKPSAG